ncbi:hypothetical protein BOX15_Mlig018138g2 [Macrostomum lignano]|uniref:Protein kinase domain-containing protein n=1 Tax=Macrostomum lignano TaxID=282301 RepID=A0A267FUK1_9PLAT|nr:hypothetical protein BOX15_Mlig018138g2 [Macrostomum lignano]
MQKRIFGVWLTLQLLLALGSGIRGGALFSCGGGDMPIRLVGELPADRFNASSVYAHFNPEGVKVTKTQSEMGWCPGHQLKQNRLDEWISVRFSAVKIFNTLLTQPRLHRSIELGEFTKKLVIQYKRSESEPYKNYSLITFQDGRWRSNLLIKGNGDLKDKRNYVSLRPPLIADRVRVFPVNPDPNEMNVCLKFELFGCPRYQGVLSYSAPVGHGEFSDKFYDGRIGADGRMTGGLGQLTDYISAQTVDDDANSLFVGWNASRLTAGRFVDLEFEFDQVRLFNKLTIDVSNDFLGQNARLFSLVNVSFSVGGRHFNKWLSTRMRRSPEASPVQRVQVMLQKHVGQFVRLRLHFDADSRWMLLSEVQFDSNPVSVPPPPETPPLPPQQPHPPPQQPRPPAGVDDGAAIANNGDLRWLRTPDPPAVTGWGGEASKEHVELRGGDGSGGRGGGGQPQQRDSELTYIVIIVSSLLGALLLMLTVGLLCLRRWRLLRKKAVGGGGGHGSVGRCISMQTHLKGAETTPIHLDFASGRPAVLNGSAFVGVNGGAGGGGGGGGGGGSIGGGSKNLGVYNSLPESDDDEDSDDSLADSVRIVSGCGGGVGGPADEPLIGAGAGAREYASATLSMLYSPKAHYSATAAMASPYSRTRITTNPLAELTPVARARLSQQQSGYSPHRGYPSPVPPPPSGLLVGLPMATPPPVPRFPSDLNIQGCSGNTVYACPAHLQSAEPAGQDELAGLEVPAASVSLKERLGGGQFGEVRLAEWRPSGSPDSTPPLLVAVKTLRRDAGPQAKQDFRREIRLLARLDDPNVVRVLGVVTRDPKAPQCALVEYMRYGDLHQLLRHRVSPATVEQPGLSYGCLIYLAGQVASGMKYLEAMQVTHRDLACRNCLLGDDFQVKICDFGMSRPIYSSDYCRVDGGRGSALPIRWMSWEAVLQGRFSSRSDVWSFAVTLWEMLTFCREQPFSNLNDEQVVANCQHIWLCDGLAQALPCPPGCQRELYDLMCECWQRDEACRPAFREIHLFLQRKNIGFAPGDDRLLRQLA